MSIADLIPGFTQAKAIAGAVGLAALAVPIVGWSITAHTLHGVRTWQADVVARTSRAAHVVDNKGRPATINVEDVPLQIEVFGQALDLVDSASATVIAGNTTNNTRIGAAQNVVGQETGNAIEQQISDARAAGAADYARRMRAAQSPACAGNPGSAGQFAATAASGPAPGPAQSGGVSLLDEEDVRVCSDNTVKARGWQEYWRKIDAIPQTVPTVASQ